MQKLKLGVIFGGMSTEHDVSVTSGTSVIKNLNKEKYEIYPIYIDNNGKWYEYSKKVDEIDILQVGEKIEEKIAIANPIEYLEECDVIFPVLHGLYGEDGTIQGLFELLKKPYVGCKVLASSICMDKAYSKIIFEKAGINQAKYIYVKISKINNKKNIDTATKNNLQVIYIDNNFNEHNSTLEEIANIVEQKLSFPTFVKPSNSGSSVGIKKAHNKAELIEAIKYAGGFDKKILIEQNIEGREVECAVLGNDDVKASVVGEILPAEDFYTFDAKYKNAESRVVIPAEISENISDEIRKTAIKAYKATDCKGLARVDFFIENGTNKVIINEINTLPGFTQISMYPQLWQSMGISYTSLLDKLVELALEAK